MGATLILYRFFFCLVFNVFSLLFWYFPFILLHDLVSFSGFLHFVVFSFQFATHFAIFHVAVYQISRGSSILCLLLSILLLCFTSLRFCGLFLSIGHLLLSFSYISYRFYAYLVFSFNLRHFGFTLLACCLIRDDKQSELHKKTWLTASTRQDYLAMHFAQAFPRLFTMFISFLDMSISLFKVDLP